jgi:NADPH:quinone reductase-like Zn-dependent oxidoreductase
MVLPNEVLRIQEIDKPTPKADEVLIKVLRSQRKQIRLSCTDRQASFYASSYRLSKPRLIVIGSDFAGQVEAVGSAVTSFKAGDRVMGFAGALGYGTLTEYITFPESKGIVLMPSNISYEQAAACLEGTFYAAAGLNELKPTQDKKHWCMVQQVLSVLPMYSFLKYYGVYVTAYAVVSIPAS